MMWWTRVGGQGLEWPRHERNRANRNIDVEDQRQESVETNTPPSTPEHARHAEHGLQRVLGIRAAVARRDNVPDDCLVPTSVHPAKTLDCSERDELKHGMLSPD